ncbi:hypothetical protein BDQ17DRAFT_1194476, partial [Cyathus striatus]
WWLGHRAQFPNLYYLAMNVLSIPGNSDTDMSGVCYFVGSAVGVERVFSGGRDTVSLRRASLSAETIRTLML